MKSRVWIVIKHVFLKNLLTPGYLIMLLSPLVLGIVSLLVYSQMRAPKQPQKIAIICDDSQIKSDMGRYVNDSVVFTMTSHTKEQVLNDYERGRVDGYLRLTSVGNYTVGRLVTKKSVDENSKKMITSIIQREVTDENINRSSIELNQKEKIKSQIVWKKSGVNRSKHLEVTKVRTLIVNGISILFGLLLLFYCQIVSQEIVFEKGSHSLEIILSSISPLEHFLGKILGVLLLMIVQLVAYASLIPIVMKLLKMFLFVNISLPDKVFDSNYILVLVYTVAFALLGLISYLTISALLSSMVINSEQVGEAITPILLLSLASYYSGLAVVAKPKTNFVRIASYLPLFSQNIMPARIAGGQVEWLPAICSLGIYIIFIFLLVIVSAKIYMRSITSYKNIDLGQIIHWIY